jgi:hypothetical protein
MRDPQQALEQLRTEQTITGEPGAAMSCPPGSEGAGRRRGPVMTHRAALRPYPEEVQLVEGKRKGPRKLTEEQYDGLLSEFVVGEYGEAELGEEEKRLTIRSRLKTAAKRRGIAIDFKRTQGDVIPVSSGRAITCSCYRFFEMKTISWALQSLT